MKQIVFLNGASSVGKTTLALGLQEALSTPFLLTGIDHIIEMMPRKLNDWHGEEVKDGYYWKVRIDDEGNRISDLQMGAFGAQMEYVLKAQVFMLAQKGYHIIVDNVVCGKEEIDLWKKCLKTFDVLWVGLQASIETLEKREQERQDRMKGSARSFYQKVHQNVEYDVMLDTSKTSQSMIIEELLTWIL